MVKVTVNAMGDMKGQDIIRAIQQLTWCVCVMTEENLLVGFVCLWQNMGGCTYTAE